MAGEKDEVVRSLTELLALAKVAMPDHVFDTDPRVDRARRLIATKLVVPTSWPPPTAAVSGNKTMAVALPSETKKLDHLSGAAEVWDITAGLDAFMASGFAPATRTEATVLIIRDWLIGHGYIDPPPEEAH